MTMTTDHTVPSPAIAAATAALARIETGALALGAVTSPSASWKKVKFRPRNYSSKRSNWYYSFAHTGSNIEFDSQRCIAGNNRFGMSS